MISRTADTAISDHNCKIKINAPMQYRKGTSASNNKSSMFEIVLFHEKSFMNLQAYPTKRERML